MFIHYHGTFMTSSKKIPIPSWTVICFIIYGYWMKVNIRKLKNPKPALFLKMNIYSLAIIVKALIYKSLFFHSGTASDRIEESYDRKKTMSFLRAQTHSQAP